MMSKDGFPFANPELIPKLMANLELKYLRKYTPCQGLNEQDLANALAVVHVELIIIHPFREENGRIARMLANLMALQAGKDIINYTQIDRTVNFTGYVDYISAIHEGFCGKYKKIQDIFCKLLKNS